MPPMWSWTTTPSHRTSNACGANFNRSMPHSTPFKRFTEWVIAGSSEHSTAIADCRAHHPGAALGGLPVRPGTRDRVAQLTGAIAAGERRYHGQCAVGAAAARVPRSQRLADILGGGGRSLCLSPGYAAAA